MKHILKAATTLFFVMALLGIGMTAFVEANYLPTSLGIFGYMLVIGLLISCRPNWYVEIALSLLALLGTCYYYFPLDDALSFKWLWDFSELLVAYFRPSQHGNYTYLPEYLALVLMLIFIYLLTKLIIRYGIWQLPFLFIVSYLSILSVVNQTELTRELIFAAVTGFMLAVWLQQKEQRLANNFLQLIGLSALILAGAYSAWHLPDWFPKSHNALQTQTESLRIGLRRNGFFDRFESPRNGQFTATGFSENDEVLGGAIYPNNDVLFTAKQTESHYWKVETKDYYSGKGWQSTVDDRQSISESPFTLAEEGQAYSRESQSIDLAFTRRLTYLPKPAGKINWQLPNEWTVSGEITYSSEQSRVYLPRELEINEVTYDYYPPSYSLEQLEKTSAIYDLTETHPYLQLPESLPQRITVLAREKVMSADSDYAKVKALETYLKSDSDFSYSMSQAQTVPKNQDYVEHFLFESKVGYCEHYSSAMVVMLRSIGIPARWVKGFNGGTELEKLADGRNTYRVTNADAHAWVEVYFSGVGWVPFEPTKTFVSQEQTALLAQSGQSSESEPLTPGTTTSSAPLTGDQEQRDPEEAEALAAQAASTNKPAKQQGSNQFVSPKQRLWLSGGLCLLLLIAVLGSKRLRWLVIFLKLNWVSRYLFADAFNQALVLVEKASPRLPSDTLREYYGKQQLADQPLPLSFLTLLESYELQHYGQEPASKPSPAEVKLLKELYQWTVNKKKS